MKKLSVLFLMVMVGIGMMFSPESKADSSRTIALKSKSVLSANTVVSANGIDVYRITGNAGSANAVWIAYDVATVAAATGVAANSQANIKAEGGEATQYDAIDIDFGPDGLRFETGCVIVTSTANLSVLYR